MKFLKLSLVAVISLFSYSQFALATSADAGANTRPDVAGFVIAASGTLTATNEAGVTRELARRSQFYSNEILKTGKDSSAQLRFKDRALMTLRADSQLNIEEYHFGGADDSQNKSVMNLVSGGFRTISGSIGKADKSAYRINTPAASIGIRGTDYELIISLDGKVFAAVHDGGITLVNDLGDLDLGSDSDYLFAEVGSGQSPLGLTEMPDVFKVEGGEKKELSDEQKAALAKKLAEGKEKVESLLADLGEGDDTDRGDTKRTLAEIALKADDSVDTRLPAALMKKLREEGEFSLNASEKSGGIASGKSITQEDGSTIFLTDKNELFEFKTSPIKHNGQTVATQHENVQWGTWNKGASIGEGGVRVISKLAEDQYFMSTRLMEVAAVQDATGSTYLPLSALTGGTSHPDIASVQSFDGGVMLDFNAKTVDGGIMLGLVDNNSNSMSLELNFDGAMLSGGQLNHNFNASVTATTEQQPEGITLNNGINVQGSIAAPTVDNDIDTAAFAGAFDASLPTEVTQGIKVGVRGMFVFSDYGVIAERRMKPAPFL